MSFLSRSDFQFVLSAVSISTSVYLFLRSLSLQKEVENAAQRSSLVIDALKQKVTALSNLNEVHCKTLEIKVETLNQKCELLSFQLQRMEKYNVDITKMTAQDQMQELSLFRERLAIKMDETNKLASIEHHLHGQLKELQNLRECLVPPPTFKGFREHFDSDNEKEETKHYTSPVEPVSQVSTAELPIPSFEQQTGFQGLVRSERVYEQASIDKSHEVLPEHIPLPKSAELQEEILETIVYEHTKPPSAVRISRIKTPIDDQIFDVVVKGVQDQHQVYETHPEDEHTKVTVTRSSNLEHETE